MMHRFHHHNITCHSPEIGIANCTSIMFYTPNSSEVLRTPISCIDKHYENKDFLAASGHCKG